MYGSDDLYIISKNTLSVIKTIETGPNPANICFDGTYIYIANYGSNNISVLVGL